MYYYSLNVPVSQSRFPKAQFTYKCVLLCLWRRTRSRDLAIWHCRFAGVGTGTNSLHPICLWGQLWEGHQGTQFHVGLRHTPVLWRTQKMPALRLLQSPTHLVIVLIKARFDPCAFFHTMLNSWSVWNKGDEPHEGILLPVFLPSKIVCCILDILLAPRIWMCTCLLQEGLLSTFLSLYTPA